METILPDPKVVMPSRWANRKVTGDGRPLTRLPSPRRLAATANAKVSFHGMRRRNPDSLEHRSTSGCSDRQ